MTDDFWTWPIPLDRWLVKLAQGWQLEGYAPDVMTGGHGRWCIFMWRSA